MVLKKELRDDVIRTLKSIHPYEEPAYHFIQISLQDFRHNLQVGTERDCSFFGPSAADRFMNSSMASLS